MYLYICIAILFFLVMAFYPIKKVKENEIYVIERNKSFNRLALSGTQIIIPFIERVKCVVCLDNQEIESNTNIVISVDGKKIIFKSIFNFHVIDAYKAAYETDKLELALETELIKIVRDIVGKLNSEDVNNSIESIKLKFDKEANKYGCEIEDIYIRFDVDFNNESIVINKNQTVIEYKKYKAKNNIIGSNISILLAIFVCVFLYQRLDVIINKLQNIDQTEMINNLEDEKLNEQKIDDELQNDAEERNKKQAEYEIKKKAVGMDIGDLKKELEENDIQNYSVKYISSKLSSSNKVIFVDNINFCFYVIKDNNSEEMTEMPDLKEGMKKDEIIKLLKEKELNYNFFEATITSDKNKINTLCSYTYSQGTLLPKGLEVGIGLYVEDR